ncbi:MAG: hypothetical protein WC810_27580 [Janthinobacterium sp.]|jgi:hypothetical protein|uniref:Uncharacterized protein n=1 Tax=Dyadobacter pollutisoli TaxID=2910158 RepID=A0A9E8N9P2_9BACT|nr:hypothetical protein [Dyadobacter pollutisoli]WAC11062.1 hypothetical protein ON006_25415 [Dyadobacter pollutisoli]
MKYLFLLVFTSVSLTSFGQSEKILAHAVTEIKFNLDIDVAKSEISDRYITATREVLDSLSSHSHFKSQFDSLSIVGSITANRAENDMSIVQPGYRLHLKLVDKSDNIINTKDVFIKNFAALYDKNSIKDTAAWVVPDLVKLR